MHAWRSLSRSILVFTNVLFLLLGSVLVTLGGKAPVPFIIASRVPPYMRLH